MNLTSGEMEIIACKFLNRDCRDSWDKILTIYGTCLVFTPSSGNKDTRISNKLLRSMENEEAKVPLWSSKFHFDFCEV